MNREEILKMLDAPEEYYTDEYLEEVPAQVELIKKLIGTFSNKELHFLVETLHVCKHEFYLILEYLNYEY